jgi:serine/threonine-protein kinase
VLPTQADNVGQVFKNIVARPIRPIAQAVPELPADVAALVDRMLSRARKNRPGDLHEVAEVLARHTDVRAPDFGSVSQSRPKTDEAATATGDPSVDGAAPMDPLADTQEGREGSTTLARTEAPATHSPSPPAEARAVNDSGGMAPTTTNAQSPPGPPGAETPEKLAGGALAPSPILRRWRAAVGVMLGAFALVTSYALVRHPERAPTAEPPPTATAPMPPSVAAAPSTPVAEKSADAFPAPAPEPTAGAAASGSASNPPGKAEPPPRRAAASAVARPPPAPASSAPPGARPAKSAAPKVDILRLPQ